MSVINVRKANLIKLGYKDFQDWVKDPNNIYIGRALVYVGAKQSKWHNPFNVKKYGRDECLRLYEAHLRDSGLINEIEELRGKNLGCWCVPERCHGDILLDALKKSML